MAVRALRRRRRYSIAVFPGPRELRMWHAALDEVVRHAWHTDTPSFGTGIVTISVPVVPRPNDPLYLALVEKSAA